MLDIWGYPWSPLTALRPAAPENNQRHQAGGGGMGGPVSGTGPGLGLWGVAGDLADWILWFWRRRCQRELRLYSQAPRRRAVWAALLPCSLSGAPWESRAVIYGLQSTFTLFPHVCRLPGRGRVVLPGPEAGGRGRTDPAMRSGVAGGPSYSEPTSHSEFSTFSSHPFVYLIIGVLHKCVFFAQV